MITCCGLRSRQQRLETHAHERGDVRAGQRRFAGNGAILLGQFRQGETGPQPRDGAGGNIGGLDRRRPFIRGQRA